MEVISDPSALAIVAATFIVAGLVKGVVGLGLPTIALAVFTVTLGLQAAMALLLAPSIITNIWQAVAGPALGTILRRLWSFFAAIFVGAWFGAMILARSDAGLLAGLLGCVLMLYSAVSLLRFRVPPPGRSEGWLSPVLGVFNGLLSGMTGTMVLPGLVYIQALGLGRDDFVQAMGVLFLTCTLAIGVGLGGQGLLTGELAFTSAVGVVPALVGMWLGQKVRKRLPEAVFRQLLFVSLFLLGAYIAWQALA